MCFTKAECYSTNKVCTNPSLHFSPPLSFRDKWCSWMESHLDKLYISKVTPWALFLQPEPNPRSECFESINVYLWAYSTNAYGTTVLRTSNKLRFWSGFSFSLKSGAQVHLKISNSLTSLKSYIQRHWVPGFNCVSLALAALGIFCFENPNTLIKVSN